MAREVKARAGEEIWETSTDGRVWVSVTDDRGKERDVSVGGKAGSRLRISTMDREINQGRPMHGDAFTNGMLIRVDETPAAPTTPGEQALSTDRLLIGFSKTGQAFKTFVAGLNEFNTRRMRGMCETVDASGSQTAHLDDVIRTRYRKEGDTPTYREMKDLRSA